MNGLIYCVGCVKRNVVCVKTNVGCVKTNVGCVKTKYVLGCVHTSKANTSMHIYIVIVH